MTTVNFNMHAFASTSRGSRVYAMLANHDITAEKMLADIHAEVLEVLPGLTPGGRYLTQDLCGPDLWVRFRTKGVRRCAGMCLVYLVEIGAVPLVIATGPRRVSAQVQFALTTPATPAADPCSFTTKTNPGPSQCAPGAGAPLSFFGASTLKTTFTAIAMRHGPHPWSYTAFLPPLPGPCLQAVQTQPFQGA